MVIPMASRSVELSPGRESVPLPGGWQDEWGAVAAATGMVVVTITSAPLSSPGLAQIDRLVESGAPMWLGRARVRG